MYIIFLSWLCLGYLYDLNKELNKQLLYYTILSTQIRLVMK